MSRLCIRNNVQGKTQKFYPDQSKRLSPMYNFLEQNGRQWLARRYAAGGCAVSATGQSGNTD
jgi:hypothetical protein